MPGISLPYGAACCCSQHLTLAGVEIGVSLELGVDVPINAVVALSDAIQSTEHVAERATCLSHISYP